MKIIAATAVVENADGGGLVVGSLYVAHEIREHPGARQTEGVQVFETVP